MDGRGGRPRILDRGFPFFGFDLADYDAVFVEKVELRRMRS